MSELNWTGQQLNMVRDLIAEEIEKARLSHKVIPDFELGADARTVPEITYDPGDDTVKDTGTIPLVELAVEFKLTKLQTEDADIRAAQLLIRRKANLLARAHDTIIFTGQPAANMQNLANKEIVATGGNKNSGMSDTKHSLDIDPAAQNQGMKDYGEELVKQVGSAQFQLEQQGYVGSYVLLLGRQLFTDAIQPFKGSPVRPKDLMESELNGPVHRCSVLPENEGLLLSLSGDPVDCAVAVAPKFEFLLIDQQGLRKCRIFERFALRLKEKDSVIQLVRK